MPRSDKELVATVISRANLCPYCVDAHTMYLHGTGEKELAESVRSGSTPAGPAHAKLAAWAGATRTPDAPELAEPPFTPDAAPEYIGTALVFHAVNRMVSALLTGQVLPGNLQRHRLVRGAMGRVMARVIRRQSGEPGLSLGLLGDAPRGPAPRWAGDSPVGPAFAALRASAAAGGSLLSESAQSVVRAVISAWDGSHPPPASRWLDEPVTLLSAHDRPGVRLALLAALAPYRITDADVLAWRRTHPGDPELLRILAFGAILAVERIEAWVTRGSAHVAESVLDAAVDGGVGVDHVP